MEAGVSEIQVDARGKDRDGAAVPVVGLVLHPLIVGGQVQGRYERESMVDLQNILVPGVRQPSITDQYAPRRDRRGPAQFPPVLEVVISFAGAWAIL